MVAKSKPNPHQRLIDLADKQRQSPQEFFLATDRIVFGLSRDDKRPYLRVRCYYRNVSVHTWDMDELKGFVHWESEQLPEEVKPDPAPQRIQPLAPIIFDWKVYIPPEYLADVSTEYDSGEIKSLSLHGLTATLQVTGDSSIVRVNLDDGLRRPIRVRLMDERLIFNVLGANQLLQQPDALDGLGMHVSPFGPLFQTIRITDFDHTPREPNQPWSTGLQRGYTHLVVRQTWYNHGEP